MWNIKWMHISLETNATGFWVQYQSDSDNLFINIRDIPVNKLSEIPQGPYMSAYMNLHWTYLYGNTLTLVVMYSYCSSFSLQNFFSHNNHNDFGV